MKGNKFDKMNNDNVYVMLGKMINFMFVYIS
jgi:hypothetical protein